MKLPAYPKYKQSGIAWLGDVPESWDVLSMKRLTPVQRGASPRPIEDPKYFDDEGEYSWVRIADVTSNDHYLIETTQRLSDLGKSLSVPLESGSLFLSIAGSVGKPMITKIKACIHDGFVYFPQLEINTEFLYYIFESGQPYLGLGKLGTQLNLNTDTVGDIKISIPTSSEQKQIADFLDWKTGQIDVLISKKKQLIEKLKEKRIALITQAVTKGLNPDAPMRDSGIPWLGDVPKHWEVIRLRYCAAAITSGSRGWAKYFSDSGHLFLRITNLDRESIVLKLDDLQRVEPPIGAEGARTLTKSGDLLISITADLGSVAVVKPGLEPAYVSQHLCLVHLDKVDLNPTWIAYSIFSHSGNSQLQMAGYGGTKVQLNLNDIKEITFSYPVKQSEQNAIIEEIQKRTGKIESLIQLADRAVATLSEYRTALITAATTGKIDVRNVKIGKRPKNVAVMSR